MKVEKTGEHLCELTRNVSRRVTYKAGKRNDRDHDIHTPPTPAGEEYYENCHDKHKWKTPPRRISMLTEFVRLYELDILLVQEVTPGDFECKGLCNAP